MNFASKQEKRQETKVIWQRLHRMYRTHCSVAVAVSKIFRQSQNLKAGHVTPPETSE